MGLRASKAVTFKDLVQKNLHHHTKVSNYVPRSRLMSATTTKHVLLVSIRQWKSSKSNVCQLTPAKSN